MKTSKEIPSALRTYVDTLDDVLEENNLNDEVDVFLIGAHALAHYGLRRKTKDIDIYCDLGITEAKKEHDVVEQIADKIDYSHSITNRTFQPYGYYLNIETENSQYQTLDWFTCMDFSRAGDMEKAKQLYEKGRVKVNIPRVENLIGHKLAAFNPTSEGARHATDILEIWKENKEELDIGYLVKIVEENGLSSKWEQVYNTYNNISEEVEFPRSVAKL